MEISRSERIPSPAVAAPAAARAGRDAWLRYDRLAVGALLTLQLCLYFFWSTTQFPAAPGTWWQPLFDRSGPVILPVMFGVQLLLIDYRLPDVLGTEILRTMRAEGLATPAVVMTANRDEATIPKRTSLPSMLPPASPSPSSIVVPEASAQ